MKLLHQLIGAQATRTPGATALVYEQERLTYAELDRRAGVLSTHLRDCGVGPDVVVGLWLERSLDMMVGILGILKAGGAYLPIDPAHPPGRVAFMLGDANAQALVTRSSLLSNVPDSVAQAVCLESFDWEGQGGVPDDGDGDPSNLAYVIYTSGSTGRPKGVAVEHRQIVSYVRGVVERFGFESGLQHATVSTIAADLGHTVIFPALATGGCLHVISQARAESQAQLAEYFTRQRIDVLKIVPSHLAALQTGRHPGQVMPRRVLILGGEASRLDWIERLGTLAPGCEIFNHYGPTETTVGVLTYHVGVRLPATRSGTLPLGVPLPGRCIYILDPQGGLVPAGEVGELCVGGSGVARGYLNGLELTAEKFTSDPFVPDPSARLYRTGDLARALPDGNVEFCGRIDSQIKLHGNRVEPGEIEGALRDLRGVRDAVVVAREDEPGSTRLIAYVVPVRVDQPLWDSPSTCLLPDGSPVAHLNRNETDYIHNEIFVLQAYLRHGITVRDGDCIVDAGANIGLFTLFVSRLASNLRILSFEPNPAAFACLTANAKAWGAGVTCLPVGLSRANTSAEMTSFEGLSLLSGFHADQATEREVVTTYVRNQPVPWMRDERSAADVGELIGDRLRATTIAARLRTLSSVIAEEGLDRIDLLKINVEKSELDVLLGLTDADWPKIRQLVIEVDRNKNLEAITTLLVSHGYDVVVEQDALLERTELHYVYAVRPSATAHLVRQQSPAAHLRPLRPVNEEILVPAMLRTHLKERLPPYMIPSVFVLLERLPLTPNGKIDRQALPAASREAAEVAVRPFVAPETSTEKALAAIWSEILNVAQVGNHDDFFDLGGQSLAAIKAVARIRDVFGANLSLRNLFERPTVAGLSELIDGLSWVGRPHTPDDASTREEIAL